MTLGTTTLTEREAELEQVRKRLRLLLGARTAMGLTKAEQDEYAELCERERILIGAPAVTSLTGRVIDLDAAVEVERQHQDQ